MNTMQLICFLTVAETLNFARAAEQLHVTQPAVTQQIHSLETELNLRLFRRTTRNVELTQEGLIFLGDAKSIVEIFERAKKEANLPSKIPENLLLLDAIAVMTLFTEKKGIQLCDLKQGSLILLDPKKCPEEYRKLLHRILGDRSPADVYFCDTVEAAVTLAKAGYGVAMLPDFFQDSVPFIQRVPIIDAGPISYGVYYKSLTGHSLRKKFVKLAKESFSMISSS